MTLPTQPAVAFAPALIPPRSLMLWSLLVEGSGKAALAIPSISWLYLAYNYLVLSANGKSPFWISNLQKAM